MDDLSDDLATWFLEQVAEDERVIELASMYSREALAHGGADDWSLRRDAIKPEDLLSVWASVGALKPHFTGVSLPVMSRNVGDYLARFDPNRALAECEAKRRLVERYRRAVAATPSAVSSYVRGQDDGYREACLDAIRDAAAALADRPGYREEWKPQ